MTYDLIERFPYADSMAEAGRIDLKDPAARRHLESGWGRKPMGGNRGESFLWGLGDASALTFELLTPRQLEVAFRCAPRRPGERPDAGLGVSLNGELVAEVVLGRGPRDYRLTLPATEAVEGENRIVFTYRGEAPPDPGVDAPSRQARRVRWYELSLGGGTPDANRLPRLGTTGHALELPLGSRLDFFLRLPAGSTLEADRIELVGEGKGRFEIEVEEDGGAVRRLQGPSVGRRLEVELGDAGDRLVRVGMRAVTGSSTASRATRFRLERPRVLSPAVEASPPAATASDEVPPGSPRPSRPSRRPHILIYVIDTLRADRLGAYGYERPISPAIDRFADDAFLFENALAQSTWTRASMASLLTGLGPLAHGANRRMEVLSNEVVTLPELLRDAGYYSVAFANNPNVFPAFGFGQGFDEFYSLWQREDEGLVTRTAGEWLGAWSGDEPLFLYVHVVEPHDPYTPPPDLRDRFAASVPDDFALSRPPGPHVQARLSPPELVKVADHLQALYDAEVAAADRSFGQFLDLLGSWGLLEEMVVVLVSDHGEEFLDHGGWRHGKNLFAENLNVPLIMRLPEPGQGRRIEAAVQLVDVLPTLLDYLGLDPPREAEGRSLLPVLVDESGWTGGTRSLFSYLHLDGEPQASVTEGDWKLIWRRQDGRWGRGALFDRRLDPEEIRNLSAEHPVRAGYLRSAARERLLGPRRQDVAEAVVDEEILEALNALGYLETEPDSR